MKRDFLKVFLVLSSITAFFAVIFVFGGCALTPNVSNSSSNSSNHNDLVLNIVNANWMGESEGSYYYSLLLIEGYTTASLLEVNTYEGYTNIPVVDNYFNSYITISGSTDENELWTNTVAIAYQYANGTGAQITDSIISNISNSISITNTSLILAITCSQWVEGGSSSSVSSAGGSSGSRSINYFNTLQILGYTTAPLIKINTYQGYVSKTVNGFFIATVTLSDSSNESGLWTNTTVIAFQYTNGTGNQVSTNLNEF